MTGLPAWKEILRSRTAAVLTLAGGALVLLLALQVIAGWPFQRTMVLRPQVAEEEGGQVYRARIPPDVAPLDWNAPFVRVSVNGVEFAQHKGIDRVAMAAVPASYVKGRSIYLRDPTRADRPNRCEVTLPWFPDIWLAMGSVLGWGLLAGLATGARNPWLGWTWVTRQPIATGLLGALCAASLLMRIAGFSFPSWENDSDDYFRPVFQWLSGLQVTPTDRPLGYPAFIATALVAFHDFRALVVLNMAASLAATAAMGCVFFACANRLLLPKGWRFFVKMAGLVATAYFVLNERILEREWMLLPEALAAAWLGGQLWLAWRLMAKPLPTGRALWEFGFFCALGWLTFFTKSNWGFALGVLPLPLLVRAWLRSASRHECYRQLAAGAAVFVFVAALAFGFQRLTPLNTAASVEIRSRVMVCWHLDLVRPEIARRLAANPPAEEAALLQEFAGLLDAERAEARLKGAGAYATLGYDADRLYYFGFARAKLYRQLSSHDRAAFCRELFFGALRRNPAMYARKVLSQWALYFREPYVPPSIQMPHVIDSLELSEKFLTKPPAYAPPEVLANYRPVIERARAEIAGPWPAPSRLALSLRLQAATRLLNPTFAWSLGLPILLTVAAALWKPWRAAVTWLRLAPALGLALWATGSAAACALTSSALQALEVQRYIDLFLPLTVFSQFLWPFVALAILRHLPMRQGERRRIISPRPGSPPPPAAATLPPSARSTAAR